MNDHDPFYSDVRRLLEWARYYRRNRPNYRPTDDERRAISDLSTELGFLARELEDAA